MIELGDFPTPKHILCARSIARKFVPFGPDDVAQDALVAMWIFDRRFRDGYDDVGSYFAGCYMTGVRGAIDGIRLRHGRRKIRRPDTVEFGGDIPDRSSSVEDQATGVIDIHNAARRIAKATKDQRIVTIVRRLDEGATKDTIAHELHIHPARVSQLLRPLKRLLEEAA